MARSNGKMRSNRGKQPRIRWLAIMRKSGLTRAEVRELHGELLAKWQDLAAGINEQAAVSMCFSRGESGPCDVVDLAYREQEDVLNSGLLAGEIAELGEVGDALARMGEGTYGVCEATDQPIGITRLRARPWARFCIEYARQRDTNSHYRLPKSRDIMG